MNLVITCRQCGQEFTPAPSDFLHGTWRLCPGCRATPPSAPADVLPDPRPATPTIDAAADPQAVTVSGSA